MERLIGAVCDALKAAGIPAARSRPGGLGPQLQGGAVAVGLQRLDAGEAGLYRYLGTRQDPERGEVELYGMKLAVELSLRGLCPRAAGAAGCAALLERVQAVLLAGIAGLSLRAMARQEAEFDPATDCFTALLTARFEVWLYAEKQEDGTVFENFVLEGAVT